MNRYNDQDYLLLALKEAEKGRGFCAPNPAVGSVLVKNQKILARGYHHAAGLAHAEIDAMEKVNSADLDGASLYVTLEPCHHHGKTPPCTEAIIKNKIKNVYYSFHDLNPVVSGQGAKALIQAGIITQQIELAEITNFYRSYAHWQLTKLPFVTAKLAISLDGKVAGVNGAAVKITSDVANQFTHQQRKRADALLTSAKTINLDDPQLNARLENQVFTKPIYIIDSQNQLNPQAHIFTTAANLIIFHDANRNYTNALNKNIQAFMIKANNNYLELKQILQIIGEHGIHDLWVEAGPSLFHALHESKCVNRSYIYIAPKILGPRAISAFMHNYQYDFKSAKINWHSFGIDSCCQLDWE